MAVWVPADAGVAVLSEGLAPSVIALAAMRGVALVAAAVPPEGLEPSEIASVLVGGEEVSVLDSPPVHEGWMPRRGPRVCGGLWFALCPR